MSTEFALVLTNALRSVLKPQQQSRDALKAQSAAERSFEAKLIPRMGLEQFMQRVVEYMHVDNDTLLCGMYYILLLCGETNNYLNMERGVHTVGSAPRRSRPYVLTMYNVHRFVFAAMLVATKWRSESRVSMEYYALVCGIPRSELCRIEWSMLELLDFNATVTEPAMHFVVSYVVSCTIKPSDVIPAINAGHHMASVDDACSAVKYCNAHEGWSATSSVQVIKTLVHAFEDASEHNSTWQRTADKLTCELEKRTVAPAALLGIVNVFKRLTVM